MKYNAHHKDQPINAVTLDGKEYKAKDGIIDVPDDHQTAHAEAQAIGLTAHYDKHAGAEKPHNAEATDKHPAGKSTR